MTSSLPITISVIIPTYNRSRELENTIHSLCNQTWPPERMEVLVIADGCTDGTMDVLRTLCTPFPLHGFEQPNQGAGAARNLGARHARGEILLFIDDDIEAEPELVEAHARLHQEGPGQVVIGYLPTILAGKQDFFENQLRIWWEAMFQQMRQPGHRFRYSDLLSGNFSLEATLFAKTGGFRSEFRCHEDYEIGVRLLQAGGRFRFAPGAAGTHHERTDLQRALRRKTQEGMADVKLGQCYPELIPALLMTQLNQYALPASRVLRLLAFHWPAAGDFIADFFQQALVPVERAKLRKVWRRILDGLMGYWYWRGVAQELPTLRQSELFLSSGPNPVSSGENDLEIDLQLGLGNAERLLDAHRPAQARLTYGRHPIGMIPALPGAEPLRGHHLRSILARELTVPLLRVLALEGKLGFPELSEKILAACNEQLLS